MLTKNLRFMFNSPLFNYNLYTLLLQTRDKFDIIDKSNIRTVHIHIISVIPIINNQACIEACEGSVVWFVMRLKNNEVRQEKHSDANDGKEDGSSALRRGSVQNIKSLTQGADLSSCKKIQ